ncbi:MAG: mannose-1-phosphate guanylyltransferase [Planctomycetaceae bacterium]|jgi:mannose-1-phosphate guanylyltransferase|nr:mannose-1-phosphate guanylyltransferase [Planctomycetaceae bacterium]
MLHAVIMAGGAGTRFWPASRKATPKQLLNLVGDRTMIQATLDRVEAFISPEQMLVVTNASLVDSIRSQLPALPEQAVIGEPCKRDTAPCVGLAAAIVARDDGDATMLVMPADHVIQATDKFHSAVTHAANIVDAKPKRIVTFGIKPTYPASSFGYIERGEALSGDIDSGTYRVRMFREKPSVEAAEEYLASGSFYWNAGIFVWKASTILSALAEHEPEMHSHIMTIAEVYGSEQFGKTLETEFAKISGKSIDYAVMEKYDDVVVIEAPFDWDDVGGWRSLARQHATDDAGNTVIGRHLSVDSNGCIVRTSDDHLVVTLGMEDCIVVHTPDATLVARKQDEESIRRVVELLQEKGWDEHL